MLYQSPDILLLFNINDYSRPFISNKSHFKFNWTINTFIIVSDENTNVLVVGTNSTIIIWLIGFEYNYIHLKYINSQYIQDSNILCIKQWTNKKLIIFFIIVSYSP